MTCDTSHCNLYSGPYELVQVVNMSGEYEFTLFGGHVTETCLYPNLICVQALVSCSIKESEVIPRTARMLWGKCCLSRLS